MSVWYSVHPELTHINAPDAWMVWRETLNDYDDETESTMIAHGVPLINALSEIRLDYEGYSQYYQQKGK